MEHQTVIPYTQQIKAIKSAILQSRYRAAAHANAEMLSLYYGIGEYISRNSRKGFWGTRITQMTRIFADFFNSKYKKHYEQISRW